MFASLEVIAKLRKELDAAEAAWLHEVAAYDRSGDWRAEGFMNPASALRHACHMSQGVARAHLELARKLEDLPEVAAAFADGEISARHATAIATSYTPERAAELNEVEGALVDFAREATPHELGSGREVRDRRDRRRRRRGRGRGPLPAARGCTCRTPSTACSSKTACSTPKSARIREAAIEAEMARDLGANDDRSLAQRRADASTNIMRLYLDRGEAGESHGVRPHVSYVSDAERDLDAPADLVARAIAERQHHGRLSEAMLELLLCDCDISRVIVAGRSEILDVGRADAAPRPPAQWKALVVRDQHCQHPGCDQPPSRCASTPHLALDPRRPHRPRQPRAPLLAPPPPTPHPRSHRPRPRRLAARSRNEDPARGTICP